MVSLRSRRFTRVRPRWRIRREAESLACQGMRECQTLREQTERWIIKPMRLCLAEQLPRQIRLFTTDRPAEFPEVDADLIGASGERTDFEERCPIGVTRENTKLRPRRESVRIAAARP
jgi:hypothetical protein